MSLFQSSEASPSHRDLSKIISSGLARTPHSSLSICGCNPAGLTEQGTPACTAPLATLLHLPQQPALLTSAASQKTPQPNGDRPCHLSPMPATTGQEGLMAVAPHTMHASDSPLQGPNPPTQHQNLGRKRASPLDAQHQTRPQKLCLCLPAIPLPLSSGLASPQPGRRGQRPVLANSSPAPHQTPNPQAATRRKQAASFLPPLTFQAQRTPSQRPTLHTQGERCGINTGVGSGQEGREGASAMPVPAPRTQHSWET